MGLIAVDAIVRLLTKGRLIYIWLIELVVIAVAWVVLFIFAFD
jgi:hypothetical protein